MLGSTSSKYFKARIKWSHCDEKVIKFLCSDVKFKRPPEELPDFLLFLDDLLTSAKNNGKVFNFIDKEIPFFDILDIVGELCMSRVYFPTELFSDEAKHELRNQLVGRLSYLSQQCLLNEMYLYNRSYKEFCGWLYY